MELTLILAASNVALAALSFYFARKKESRADASMVTEVIVELRTVRRDVSELKNNVQSMRDEWKADHDILTGLAREMEAVWRVVDRLQAKEEE